MRIVAERAPMTVLRPGLILCYYSLTSKLNLANDPSISLGFHNLRICRIICPFPFKTERVSDIIFVFFVELVISYPSSEGFSPEHDGFLDVETNNLET